MIYVQTVSEIVVWETRRMKSLEILQQELESGALDGRLRPLCGPDSAELVHKRSRLAALAETYRTAFGAGGEVGLFSSPGRTEMGGNHTDHQHGCVLAGAVNMDMLACARPVGGLSGTVGRSDRPDTTSGGGRHFGGAGARNRGALPCAGLSGGRV